MAPAIPDRWIPYSTCGAVIEGTKIISFKVPLRKHVQTSNKDIEEIWDIKTLLEKIPTLGAVIDLTNTNRYYDPKEFEAAGVLYKKILIPGRIIPPEGKVLKFMETLEDFLRKDCGLIGVHCTHGLNRTGYMVCRFMRDRLGIPPMEAIQRFETARGYKIERSNYVADILREKVIPPPDFDETIHPRAVSKGGDMLRAKPKPNLSLVEARPSRARNSDFTYKSPLAETISEDDSTYSRRYRRMNSPVRSEEKNERYSNGRYGKYQNSTSADNRTYKSNNGGLKSEDRSGSNGYNRSCYKQRYSNSDRGEKSSISRTDGHTSNEYLSWRKRDAPNESSSAYPEERSNDGGDEPRNKNWRSNKYSYKHDY